MTASGYSLPVAIRLLTHAELPRLSYPFRAAELIDALPSYCEATTRIYQTYALLRAQSQMDPDKSLIQVVLIRSLHKGQTDNSGKAVLENTVCQQLSFTTPIHSDANPSHPRHHQPERMSCYTGQRRNSMWRPTRHCASGQHDGPCYIFLSACRLCEETGTCLELFVLQAPAANEESRTRECLSQPCSPLDTPLNFRFLLTLKPSSQSELTDANPFGHLGPSAQQDKEVGMKLLAISGQGQHALHSHRDACHQRLPDPSCPIGIMLMTCLVPHMPVPRFSGLARQPCRAVRVHLLAQV
ncbi:hypothetical protein WJX84_010331 [Apatococcus fuscideae]|uniref:Uncharacterized protein n=1 Tax=Apatococcus fuscideae TaxID=2026836 RepID=A0AAW1TFB8_9CHLO